MGDPVRQNPYLKTGMVRMHAFCFVYESRKAAAELGHALKTSALPVERGFAWAGRKMGAAAVDVVKGVGTAAGKLIETGGWIGEEAGAAVEKLGQEIEKLGRIVEPGKRQAATQAVEPGGS